MTNLFFQVSGDFSPRETRLLDAFALAPVGQDIPIDDLYRALRKKGAKLNSLRQRQMHVGAVVYHVNKKLKAGPYEVVPGALKHTYRTKLRNPKKG